MMIDLLKATQIVDRHIELLSTADSVLFTDEGIAASYDNIIIPHDKTPYGYSVQIDVLLEITEDDRKRCYVMLKDEAGYMPFENGIVYGKDYYGNKFIVDLKKREGYYLLGGENDG
jgi:hypothetical protein